MAGNGWEWLGVAGSGWEWLGVAGNGLEWLRVARSGEEWLRIARKRSVVHDHGEDEITLRSYIGNYAWHGNHHLAHVKQASNSGGEWARTS